MQSLPTANSSLVSDQISVHPTLQIDAKGPIVKILTGWVDCLWVDLPSSPDSAPSRAPPFPHHFLYTRVVELDLLNFLWIWCELGKPQKKFLISGLSSKKGVGVRGCPLRKKYFFLMFFLLFFLLKIFLPFF